MNDPDDILITGAALAESYNRDGKGFDNTGKMNAYECEDCRAYIVTIDRNPGVTPFMTKCGICGGMATSKMYRVADWLEPTHEWYRPRTLDGISPSVYDHLSRGGLILRPIAGASWQTDTAGMYPQNAAAIKCEMERRVREQEYELAKATGVTRQQRRHAKRKNREAPATIQMWGRTYNLAPEGEA